VIASQTGKKVSAPPRNYLFGEGCNNKGEHE
jgi:hypothetical protein